MDHAKLHADTAHLSPEERAAEYDKLAAEVVAKHRDGFLLYSTGVTIEEVAMEESEREGGGTKRESEDDAAEEEGRVFGAAP